MWQLRNVSLAASSPDLQLSIVHGSVSLREASSTGYGASSYKTELTLTGGKMEVTDYCEVVIQAPVELQDCAGLFLRNTAVRPTPSLSTLRRSPSLWTWEG